MRKLEMTNDKWQIISHQYNLLFLIFKLFICQCFYLLMASYIKKLLKQLSFYEKSIKPRIKKFTNAKLLPWLPFFEKPNKAEIKQWATKKLLQEQPFYKQSIKKPCIKKLSNQELLRESIFCDDISISRNERVLRGYAETYKVEIIDNRNLSGSLSVSKNSIKNLFNELLREKKGF